MCIPRYRLRRSAGTVGNLFEGAIAFVVKVNPANFTLTATPSSQTITDGQTAQFSLIVTPQGSLTTPVNFACDGLPAMTTCSFSPASVTPDTDTVTTTLTIKTVGNAMVPTLSLLPRFGHRVVYPLGALAAVLMALIAMLLAEGESNRRLKTVIPTCVLMLVLMSLAACAGNGGKASNSSGSTTPLGTTKVTVTATATAGSGTVNHSTHKQSRNSQSLRNHFNHFDSLRFASIRFDSLT